VKARQRSDLQAAGLKAAFRAGDGLNEEVIDISSVFEPAPVAREECLRRGFPRGANEGVGAAVRNKRTAAARYRCVTGVFAVNNRIALTLFDQAIRESVTVLDETHEVGDIKHGTESALSRDATLREIGVRDLRVVAIRAGGDGPGRIGTSCRAISKCRSSNGNFPPDVWISPEINRLPIFSAALRATRSLNFQCGFGVGGDCAAVARADALIN
jgi:hypothetical protein